MICPGNRKPGFAIFRYARRYDDDGADDALETIDFSATGCRRHLWRLSFRLCPEREIGHGERDRYRRRHRGAQLGESPEGIDLSRDGRLLAAASELANGVVVIDTGAGYASWTLKVPGKHPEHAVFSPDRRWLYVSAEDGAQVDVIDVGRRTVVASVPVGRRPRGIAFTPDGATAWVACELDGTLYPIDVATRTPGKPVSVGPFSNGVVVATSGAKVYVSSGRGARVDVVDVAEGRVSASIPVGQRPWNMAQTPDGRKLYVANGRSGTASVIDTETGKRIADIPVGELPWGVAIR